MTKKTTKQQIEELKEQLKNLDHQMNLDSARISRIQELLDQTINDQIKNDVDYNQRFNKIREENTKQWEAIKRRQLKQQNDYQPNIYREFQRDERRY